MFIQATSLELIPSCRMWMSQLPSSLTNVTPKETLQQHPSFGTYVVDKISMYATSEKTSIYTNEPPHWQSNLVFRTEGFDSGAQSLKLDPTMVLRGENDTRAMFEVSLVPGVEPGEEQTANKLVSLKNPIPLAQLLNELEINGLFDYEPAVVTKGSLWWHYGLISWLEQKEYSVPGSTADFLQWLAIHGTDIRAGYGGSSQGISEIDSYPSTRGRFTRGECQVVHAGLEYG
jgi:hypothetical protein